MKKLLLALLLCFSASVHAQKSTAILNWNAVNTMTDGSHFTHAVYFVYACGPVVGAQPCNPMSGSGTVWNQGPYTWASPDPWMGTYPNTETLPPRYDQWLYPPWEPYPLDIVSNTTFQTAVNAGEYWCFLVVAGNSSFLMGLSSNVVCQQF